MLYFFISKFSEIDDLHPIKINLPGLLQILGSNLYSESDFAIREMIQNAHDTCILRKIKDHNFSDPVIQIN